VSLPKTIEELIGRVCLAAIAQPETGGNLLLHFGRWQTYENPPDPGIAVSERGNWSLMIKCPWRLDSNTAVICDWRSTGDAENARAEAHLSMEGLTVEDVELSHPGLDFRLRFSSGHQLLMLCDSAGAYGDCWYLLRPDDSSVAATRDFRLVYEPPPTSAPGDDG